MKSCQNSRNSEENIREITRYSKNYHFIAKSQNDHKKHKPPSVLYVKACNFCFCFLPLSAHTMAMHVRAYLSIAYICILSICRFFLFFLPFLLFYSFYLHIRQRCNRAYVHVELHCSQFYTFHINFTFYCSSQSGADASIRELFIVLTLFFLTVSIQLLQFPTQSTIYY